MSGPDPDDAGQVSAVQAALYRRAAMRVAPEIAQAAIGGLRDHLAAGDAVLTAEENVDRAAFAAAITATYTPEGVLIWLTSVNSALGLAPCELVTDGHAGAWRQLRSMAESLAAGVLG